MNLYPPLLPAYGKEPPPPGYIERTRVNTPLVVSGAVTFSVTYIASLAIAGRQKFKNGTGALAVPLLGPWLAIAGRNINCDITVDETTGVDGIDEDIEESTDDAAKCFAKEAGTIAVMTGMGIGQIIGASLLLAGILDRRHYYLRADLGPVSFTPHPHRSRRLFFCAMWTETRPAPGYSRQYPVIHNLSPELSPFGPSESPICSVRSLDTAPSLVGK